MSETRFRQKKGDYINKFMMSFEGGYFIAKCSSQFMSIGTYIVSGIRRLTLSAPWSIMKKLEQTNNRVTHQNTLSGKRVLEMRGSSYFTLVADSVK